MLLNLMPFCMQRITRRLGGGSAGVYENTLRKLTPPASPEQAVPKKFLLILIFVRYNVLNLVLLSEV